jgi:peptidoglycan-associated lipoprotein
MKKVLIAISIATLLAACASKDKAPVTDTKPPPTAAATTTPAGPSTTPTTPSQVTSGVDPLKDPNNVLSKRIIYFDYDKDAVKGEYTEIVQAHARYLNENRGRKIRLEGHADERGSREYNMALGQRRGDAVRRAASVLGVGNERMEVISFGEDKPRSTGRDEAAWAQNRRVEIVYDGE